MSDRLEQLKHRWETDPASRHFLQYAEELRRLGHSDQAEPVLEKGLTHHPNWIAAQVSLARCRIEANRYEGAAAGLEAVVRKDPTQMVAYRLLIDAYIGLGDTVAAAERLELYRELNPQDPQCEVFEARLKALEEEAPAPAADPPEAPMATVVLPTAQPTGPTAQPAVPPPPVVGAPIVEAAQGLEEATPPPEAIDQPPSEEPAPELASPQPMSPDPVVPAAEEAAPVEDEPPVSSPESMGFTKMATEPNIQVGGVGDQPLMDFPMEQDSSEGTAQPEPLEEPVLDTASPSLDDGSPIELSLQDMPSSSLTDFPQSIELPEAGNKHTENTLASLSLEGSEPAEASPTEQISPMEVLKAEETPIAGSGTYAVQAMINLPDGRENVEQAKAPATNSALDTLLAPDEALDQASQSQDVDVDPASTEDPPTESQAGDIPVESPANVEPASPLATMRIENVPASLLEKGNEPAIGPETESVTEEDARTEDDSEEVAAAEPVAEPIAPGAAEQSEAVADSPDPTAVRSKLFPQVASETPVMELDLGSILSSPPPRPLARGGRLAESHASPAGAEQRASEEAPATVTLGGLYLDQGHSNEAKKIFEEVLSDDPENPSARDGLTKAQAMPSKLSAEDLMGGYSESAGGGLSEKKAYVLKNYMERIKQGSNDDVS